MNDLLPAATEVAPGLAALATALGADPASLSEAELVETAGVLSESKASIDAHIASLVAEVARRRGGPTDEDAAVARSLDAQGPAGSGREPKPYFWERQVFAARLRLSEYEARQLVVTAVALDGRLPNTKAALSAGAISWQHAQMLATKTTTLPEDLAGQVECQVLSDRRLVTARQYRNRAAQLADQLQPPEAGPRVRSASAWENVDGSVQVAATLDAEGGRVVAKAVEAYATPFGPDDTRAQSERWADALVEISRVALDHLDPTLANRHPLGRPHLTLTAELAYFDGSGRGSADTSRGPGQVMLDGAGYLTASHLGRPAADRLRCDATVGMVIHRGGAIRGADTGHVEQRMPTRRQRRALATRDRGCRFPGCTRPAQRCSPHHVIHHSRGGPTTVENLIMLCPEHHRTVHDDSWDLIFDGRDAIFTDPHGRRYHSPPPLVDPRPWSPPNDDPFIGPVWIRPPELLAAQPIPRTPASDEPPPF